MVAVPAPRAAPPPGSPLRLALVGTYPPRRCGIATFTQDLGRCLQPSAAAVVVVALDEGPASLCYDEPVRYAVPPRDRGAYARLADRLNLDGVDAVSIQHEFGIYGGPDGAWVLDLLERLAMPALVTLHTVLTEPTPGQRAVMEGLIRHARRLVVMTQRGRDILRRTWGVDDAQIAVVPHGIHDVPFEPHPPPLTDPQLAGKRVLLTFGLLGPGKGIETALDALPAIVAQHPDVVYLVVGATHPHVLRQEGDAYRRGLEARALELGVAAHLRFHDAFLPLDELQRYLSAATLYVVPYPNAAQICSGTLAYAAGAGNAVVSTPFWHAQELLADGRGRLFPFGDAGALAHEVNALLSDETARQALRRRAWEHGRDAVWERVGERYVRLARDVLAPACPATPRRAPAWGVAPLPDAIMPPVLRMTDDTGVFQHARFGVPDRRHGYCTDDNARALTVALDHHRLHGDAASARAADVYLAFLAHAIDENTHRFRNFMGFDRRWLEPAGSDDSHGRALAALGHAAHHAPLTDQRRLAHRLFFDALPVAEGFGSPRAWAFTLLGLARFRRHDPADQTARRTARRLTQRLGDWSTGGTFDASAAWPWPEPAVTYDATRLAEALLVADPHDTPDAAERGRAMLRWLLSHQLRDDGTVDLIGNAGWLTRDGHRAHFDQQPLEVAALVDACVAAATDDDPVWLDRARRCAAWFTGQNRRGLPMFDPDTGAAYDGLHPRGANLNHGAESVLALASVRLTLQRLDRARDAAAGPPAP